jgi:putative restriction endonuclease
VFLPPEAWFDVPASWSQSIVQGKAYSADSEEGALLWSNLQRGAIATGPPAAPGFLEQEQARYGEPVLVTPRLGQGAFRVAITELYRRQCALTGGKVLPALDAAHIRPYAEGGTHTKSNGILLRKDVHSVFDAGYATIDTDYRFVVSAKIKDIFHNGEEYRRLHGLPLRVPDNPAERPDRSLLQWHNDCRYLG